MCMNFDSELNKISFVDSDADMNQMYDFVDRL